MKKTLSIAFVLIMAMGLTACGETKEEKMVNEIVDVAQKAGENIDDQTKEMMKKALENNKEAFDNNRNEIEVIGGNSVVGFIKMYRKCLAKADTKKEATECFVSTNKKAIEMGLPDDSKNFDADEEFGDWSASAKENLLKKLEEDSKRMELMTK